LIGLFFILGLTNLFPGGGESYIAVLVHITFLVVPPFIISTIIALAGRTRLAKWITAIGLGWLFVWLMILLNTITPLIPAGTFSCDRFGIC
jgi:hypothetical protein